MTESHKSLTEESGSMRHSNWRLRVGRISLQASSDSLRSSIGRANHGPDRIFQGNLVRLDRHSDNNDDVISWRIRHGSHHAVLMSPTYSMYVLQ